MANKHDPGQIEFWVDPVCPWCWVTARWMVDEVIPARGLSVRWQPISLLFKNRPDPTSDYYAPVAETHRMLRVMESVRAAGSDDDAFAVYWHLGTRIHHDRILDSGEPVDLTAELSTLGLDPALADAGDDESWDAVISERMQRGLDLVGNDVGTPIIAFDDPDGVRRGVFGPVITRVPDRTRSLALWDAVLTLGGIDGFWELKRTRTERPDFGQHPAPRG
ncbi:MAG: disulfide bond formation protein DsbA [Actinomycetota bacterium]|jgi:hypothetical protein|nr:disulfide bond formation protein DsbA [Actinomycetota bacterium]MDA3014966.1 disulfide bond formation protein DsbA [Actinomycetota bacterium]MDA3029068.1 disulfide bond formation protein DsbA [Actinomycetota bacterium]